MLIFGTDFEAWYKQHAIRPDQFMFLVLVFFNPRIQTIEFQLLSLSEVAQRLSAAVACCVSSRS